MLDLFAGTGALGLEALSRGAISVDFVENGPAALHSLKANVAALRETKRCRIFKKDAVPWAEALGAGAIGSYLGAFLSRAGHDVTLVDRGEVFSMGLRKLWELVDHATIADGSRSRDALAANGIRHRAGVTALCVLALLRAGRGSPGPFSGKRASFAVAIPLTSRWYPREYQGVALGLAWWAHLAALGAVTLELTLRSAKIAFSARACGIPLQFGTAARATLGGDFATAITPAVVREKGSLRVATMSRTTGQRRSITACVTHDTATITATRIIIMR